MMVKLRTIVWFLFSLMILHATVLPADQRAITTACLEENSADQATVCEQAARRVASNQHALADLGTQLESKMRFHDALSVYQLGSEYYSHSKHLLRGLIRVRAALRQQMNLTRLNQIQSRANPAINSLAQTAQTQNDTQIKQLNSQLFDNNQLAKNVATPAVDTAHNTGTTHVENDYRLRGKLSRLNTGQSYALIIGNNNYRAGDFPDLYMAVNDAKKIESVLKNKYDFETQLLLNADRYEIMAAISLLRKTVRNEDRVLIYYAGHGVLDPVTNRGYWLPVDAEPENIANWISTSDVTDSLTGIAARHAIVIADSCFSGSLLRGSLTTRLDERNALLMRLDSKKSRMVLTSGGLEPVQDDGGGKHSVFAGVLIEILEQNNTILEAQRLFVQLRDQVILRADQTPQYAPIRKAGHDGGDFIFYPKFEG